MTRQAAYEIQVAIQKVVFRQALAIFPSDLFERTGKQLSFVACNSEKDEQNGRPVRVAMFIPRDFRSDVCMNAEFLAQFPDQRRQRTLASLDFAPRELPLERVTIVGFPLADQQLSIFAFNHGSHNDDRTILHAQTHREGTEFGIIKEPSSNVQ